MPAAKVGVEAEAAAANSAKLKRAFGESLKVFFMRVILF
jgi:hypothetical protein